MKSKINTSLVELSRALDTDIEIPMPEGVELYPFQKVPCQHLVKRINEGENKNILIADPMGVGKTIEAIAILNFFKAKSVLIVCPASMKGTWSEALSTFLFHKLKAKIISYNMASNFNKKWENWSFKYDFLILDECHYVKTPKSIRTKAILGRDGLIHKTLHTIALSGTPITNRPIELYPLLKALCPQTINDMSYWDYAKTFCNSFKGKWGYNVSGANKKTLPGLGVKLRSEFMVRRNKKDVLPFLPSKQVRQIIINQNTETKKLFEKISKFTTVKGDKVTLSKHVATERRMIGELKVPKTVEHIKDQLKQKDKIVVFAHHISVLDELEERLKPCGLVRLDGSTSESKRTKYVKQFQTDKETRIFLGSITAAGIGITLTASDYMVIVEPSWVPGENNQATDRIHRIGQENKVLIDFIIYENSIDKLIINAHINKKKNIDLVMG